MATYSVRAVANITRRGEGKVRRRAGLEFGASEVLVSTEPDVLGALHVTEEQMATILEDSNLRPEGSTTSTTPGLRAKEVAAPEPEGDGGGRPEVKPTREAKRAKKGTKA